MCVCVCGAGRQRIGQLYQSWQCRRWLQHSAKSVLRDTTLCIRQRELVSDRGFRQTVTEVVKETRPHQRHQAVHGAFCPAVSGSARRSAEIASEWEGEWQVVPWHRQAKCPIVQDETHREATLPKLRSAFQEQDKRHDILIYVQISRKHTSAFACLQTIQNERISACKAASVLNSLLCIHAFPNHLTLCDAIYDCGKTHKDKCANLSYLIFLL